jgi:integrase
MMEGTLVRIASPGRIAHVTEAMIAWESWARIERGFLPTTIQGYRRDLQRLAAHARMPLEALDADQLRAWVTDAGGSPGTVARHVSSLRSFYGFLVRAGYRIDDPTQKLSRPKVRHGLPKPIKDVLGRISVLDRPARLIAILMHETGLRISEACSLAVEVPVADTLLVLGKGAKERLIPLSDRARKAINALGGSVPYARIRHGYVEPSSAEESGRDTFEQLYLNRPVVGRRDQLHAPRGDTRPACVRSRRGTLDARTGRTRRLATRRFPSR